MNDGCLEGMSCPKCGSEGPFAILCTALFHVSDEGTEDHGDVEWDDESFCRCKACGHQATVGDFMEVTE
jgi:hypothetical protein